MESNEGAAAQGSEQDVLEPVEAQALAVYNPILAELERYKEDVKSTVFELTTTKGMRAAISLRAAINGIPGRLDEAYKGWNQPRLRAAEKARAKIETVKAAVAEIVKPLHDQIQVEQDKQAAKKAEETRLDGIRVAAIREKIVALQALPVGMAGETAEKIQKTIDWMRPKVIDPAKFEEFTDEATGVLANSIKLLEALHATTKKHEENEAELARLREAEAQRQREEAERAAAAEAAANAERLRLEEVAHAENERVKAEQRKQQDAFVMERLVAERVSLMRNKVFEVQSQSSEVIGDAITFVENMPFEDVPEDTPNNNLKAVRTQTIARLADLKNTAVQAERDLLAEFEQDKQMLESMVSDLLANSEKTVADVSMMLGTAQRLAVKPAYWGIHAEALKKVRDDTVEQLKNMVIDIEAAASQAAIAANSDVDQPGELTPPSAEAEAAVQEANQESTNDQEFTDADFIDPIMNRPGESLIGTVARARYERPSDDAILSNVATSYGVSQQIALSWFAAMDFEAMARNLELQQ